jgi:hypothetical protein
MPLWKSIPGETPIEDVSGLKIKGLQNRADLNRVEAENIGKACGRPGLLGTLLAGHPYLFLHCP